MLKAALAALTTAEEDDKCSKFLERGTWNLALAETHMPTFAGLTSNLPSPILTKKPDRLKGGGSASPPVVNVLDLRLAVLYC